MPETAEIVEAEVVSEEDVPGTEVAVIEAPSQVTLFGTDDPVAVIGKATVVARALADVIEQRRLYSVISGKKHVRVEGWTLLGSMLGVYPFTEWTRRIEAPEGDEKGPGKTRAAGWEARVLAKMRDGSIVGAREAICMNSESRWKSADDYAIKSMAQTRAVSGALANPLRFVMELAGYETTPESEAVEQRAENVTAGRRQARIRKIEELALETDKELAVTSGTTWNEIADQAQLHFGSPVDELEEVDLNALGTGLVRHLNQIKMLKERDALNEASAFQLSGGDQLFADVGE